MHQKAFKLHRMLGGIRRWRRRTDAVAKPAQMLAVRLNRGGIIDSGEMADGAGRIERWRKPQLPRRNCSTKQHIVPERIGTGLCRLLGDITIGIGTGITGVLHGGLFHHCLFNRQTVGIVMLIRQRELGWQIIEQFGSVAIRRLRKNGLFGIHGVKP